MRFGHCNTSEAAALRSRPQRGFRIDLRPWRFRTTSQLNHTKDLVALDFFTVPTATFRVLFVLIVLAHERRRIVHFNVTEHPTAQWTAQQVVEAFPWDERPRYL